MKFLPEIENTVEWIVNICFWTIGLIHLFWIAFFYIRIAFHREKKKTKSTAPVSIIICARNEAVNLSLFLPKVLEQNYPEFEVIVVNHQSTDDTEYIINTLKKTHAHLKSIKIEKNNHLAFGKKLPLTIGIKGAKYDKILLTDADCAPLSENWLQNMSDQFTEKKKIVLGYAPMLKEKGILNKIIRLDTSFIALNYLSYAKSGIPYMGVGRNLAYTKELFLENKGFKSHYALKSGDDDLFIQEVAKRNNYTICLNPDTFCYSEAKKTWKDWINQKSRHFTTSARYPLFKKLMLGIYPLTLLLLFISFVTLLFSGWMNWFSFSVFAFIMMTKWVVLGLSFKKLAEPSFIVGILFWDLLYAIIAPIIYYATEQSTAAKWK
ncbi:glycosyl transferase family 2 [Brumimicrobium salinarum]|uniref:Glycosyl transferase family 2 n=1 Tax=Brumimicrobium salinarum TaxID=2058658 RepID=A0A2I0R434_9FLAO|nr:glycosyltransferase [Brumimicrobium salinarum]PKR81150.1 glycosyl transferase family 2 [Brumimicrobium salinarum]